MTVDREQTRRAIALSPEQHDPFATIRALLAELEQAERERDEYRNGQELIDEGYALEIAELKARLAKADTLAEAGDAMAEWLAQTTALHSLVKAWVDAREAFAAFEAER